MQEHMHMHLHIYTPHTLHMPATHTHTHTHTHTPHTYPPPYPRPQPPTQHIHTRAGAHGSSLCACTATQQNANSKGQWTRRTAPLCEGCVPSQPKGSHTCTSDPSVSSTTCYPQCTHQHAVRHRRGALAANPHQPQQHAVPAVLPQKVQRHPCDKVHGDEVHPEPVRAGL